MKLSGGCAGELSTVSSLSKLEVTIGGDHDQCQRVDPVGLRLRRLRLRRYVVMGTRMSCCALAVWVCCVRFVVWGIYTR